MSGSLSSPRLATLFGVLRAAKGRALSNGEIVRRMISRGAPTVALHSDIADLRKAPELATLGYSIPPAEIEVIADPDGRKRRVYRYRMTAREV